ncbi:MAG: hypothetical protein CMJ28_03605 [Phycisphaerae bacterium]|nr:hypothetical protein [Phycisphaerae bacterium]
MTRRNMSMVPSWLHQNQHLCAGHTAYNETPNPSLMEHVLDLRKEAGLGSTEVQRSPSLMDHVIAMRQEIERLRAELGVSTAEA